MSGLKVQKVAREMTRECRGLLAMLAARDVDLARQLRKALTSAVLNLAEARNRTRAQQRSKLMIAYGEANEVKAILECCEDLGYVGVGSTAKAYDKADHVAAMLYRMAS